MGIHSLQFSVRIQEMRGLLSAFCLIVQVQYKAQMSRSASLLLRNARRHGWVGGWQVLHLRPGGSLCKLSLHSWFGRGVSFQTI